MLRISLSTVVCLVSAVQYGRVVAQELPGDQQVLDAYCAFLDVEIQDLHDAATRTADGLDEDAKNILLQLASTSTERPARNCAWVLLGYAQDPRLVPVVTPTIEDPAADMRLREQACELITILGDEDALPAMLAALAEPLDRETNDRLHRCAIQALGFIGGGEAASALRGILFHPAYRFLQTTIIEALGRTRDTAAVGELLGIATDPTGWNLTAAEALARIGTRESIIPLLDVVRGIPAGQRRLSWGTSIAHRLEEARERTTDSALREELAELAEAIRALALERPTSE